MKKIIWISLIILMLIVLLIINYSSQPKNENKTEKIDNNKKIVKTLSASETKIEREWGKQPIKLAFYEFGMFYDNGKGIDKDLIEEFSKRTGCKFQTDVRTRARIWSDLESGELDMSVSGIWNEERDKFAFFANYLISKNYAVIDKELAEKIMTAEDFFKNPKLQVGIVTSFKYGKEQDKWIEDLKKQNRVQESATAEAVFMKLRDHRISMMFAHPSVYSKYLKDLKMENKVVIQDWTPQKKGVEAGLILSKKRFSEKDAEKWRKVLNEMKKDGTLKKIYIKYLSEMEADRLLEF